MDRFTRAALVATATLLSSACLLEVRTVRNPEPEFARARRHALEAQRERGRPVNLELLVYDEGDSKLIRASLPLELLAKGDGELELDGDAGELAAHVRRHVRYRDLEHASRGLLVEADEGGDRVLVWLR